MFREAESLLRSTGRYAIDRSQVPWGHLAGLLAIAGFLYGAAMGLFDGRAEQALYSGLKVPLLLAITTFICLPNYFVVNTLLGLRDDFAVALRGVLAAQATFALALLSLSPLTLFLYASSRNYNLAIVFNGGMFLLATLAGQVTLARHYRPLIAANPRHRIGKLCWALLYIFVATQLAWVLRPFIGSPGMETRFFRDEAWSNAYVVVVRRVLELFGG